MKKKTNAIEDQLRGLIGKRKTTGEEIARRSGVSQATISRHLRDVGEMRVKELLAILEITGAKLEIKDGM